MAGKSKDIDEIRHKIRLKNLKEFKEFETETFFVGGNPWSLVFRKKGTDETEDHLAVCLNLKDDIRPEIWTIVAHFGIKIVSFKSTVKPHTFQSSTFFFDFKAIDWEEICNISWKELVEPERGCVYNDMCKIEIRMKSALGSTNKPLRN